MECSYGILCSALIVLFLFFFFFSSRRRHTRFDCDWSSDMCSSDLDYSRDLLEVEKDMRLRGGWDILVTDRLLRNWGPHCVRPTLPPQGSILAVGVDHGAGRSEERRVGKECRSRWSAEHEVRKAEM